VRQFSVTVLTAFLAATKLRPITERESGKPVDSPAWFSLGARQRKCPHGNFRLAAIDTTGRRGGPGFITPEA